MGKKPSLSEPTLREKIGQTCQMQSGFLMNLDTYIHAFSPCPETQIAVVQALYDEIDFNGDFPYDKPWEEDFRF